MKYLLFSHFLFFLSWGVRGQELKVNFSQTVEQHQKITGLNSRIIGSTKDFLFVECLTAKGIGGGRIRSNSVKVSFINRVDLSVSKQVEIYNRDKPEDKGFYISGYGGIVDDKIIVYYNERKPKDFNTEYARIFDLNWVPQGPPKILFQLPKTREFKNVESITVRSSDNSKFFVGAEFPAKKGESPYVDYSIFNSNLEKQHSGKFQMPIVVTSRRQTTSNSSFYLTNDGNIFLTTTVSVPEEEKKELKKGEFSTYLSLSYVIAETGEIKTSPVKFDGKNIFYTRFVFEKDKFKLVGFYSELEGDPTGEKVSGIFSASMDKANLSLSDVVFNKFSKEDILKLLSFDMTKKRQAKRADKITDENASLSSNLRIENFKTDDDGNSYLICSNMLNYSRRVCSGSGTSRSCSYQYYCDKDDTYLFKVDSKGKLEFSARSPRHFSYGGWNIYDQVVLKNVNNFFITYPTSIDDDSVALKDKKLKKISLSRREKMEYLVFNSSNNSLSKKYLYYNSPDVSRSKRLKLYPENCYTLSDGFYDLQNDYYTPTGIAVMNTTLSIATAGIYYLLVRGSVKLSTLRSRSKIVKVFPN